MAEETKTLDTVNPPTDPGKEGSQQSEFENLRKEIAGLQSLMGKHAQELGNVRKEYQTVLNNLTNLVEQKAVNGGGNDDLDYEYVTTSKLAASLADFQNNLVAVISAAGQATELQRTYNLTPEELVELQEFARQNTGGNLKAAYLLKNEGNLDGETVSTRKVAGELIKERKKPGDKIPASGDTTARSDDPGVWLKSDPDRFRQWRDKNPSAYRDWLEKKTKLKK